MTAKAGTTGEPAPTRTKRGAPQPSAATVSEGLDRLRDTVVQRLALLETQVAESLELTGTSPSEREQALRERIVVLEAAQARLQAEVKRREQEWQDLLDQLEEDRHLLAEAWDRIEKERIEAQSRPTPAPVTRGPTTQVDREVVAAMPPPAHRPTSGESSEDLMTRDILRQFQTLKNDVRRNSEKAGRSGRS
ncbi:MAG: hypothetical protein U0794_14585 [Isosphaeraceae bacterium]